MVRRLLAIMAIALLTGCAPWGGTVYHVPLAEARRILAATGLPPYVFGTNDPEWTVHAGDQDVTWTIRRGETELFHYTAHLKQVDPQNTRVEVELVGVGNAVKGLAEHPRIRDMYIVAINELVASALEHREFQIARVYPALGVATLENMGRLRASFEQAAAASERMDRENIEKAYRDEANGH